MVQPLVGRHKDKAQRRLPRLVALITMTSLSAVARSQAPPQPLPPTREEINRVAPAAPPPTSSRLKVEGGIERSPCTLSDRQFADIRFTLRGVEFDGLQDIAAADLEPAYANLLGTEQPISSVCEIRDRAATLLRSAGYVAAVEVPEQRISNGVVHLRVLLAHLTQVRVRGNASGAETILAGYLENLTKQRVFNRFQAERYLLLASDLPGYTARLTLRPAGGAPGDVIGEVVVEKAPGYADVNIQNWSSHELGPWGVLARGEAYGLLGMGDRTSLGLFSTANPREEKTVQLGHEIRLGGQGLTIGGLFTYSWAKPRIDGSDFDAQTLFATLKAEYPVIRSVGRTLRAAAGFDFVDQDVKLEGIALSRDRLRIAFARADFDSISTDFRGGRSPIEPKWHLAASAEVRKGLGLFGATDPCVTSGVDCLTAGRIPPSRYEGIATATVVRGLVYGEYRPIPKLTLAVGYRGQYARRPLLSFEQFSVGNYTVGRGYDPGALLGDRGWGSQSEIRFGSTVAKDPKRPAIEAYAFWDHARTESLERLFVVQQPNKLDAVGGGIRGAWNRFSIDAAIAVPLSKVGIPERKPDPRFLLSLTSRLWPWSLQ